MIVLQSGDQTCSGAGLYEMNEYEKSLALFYDILNKREDFEKHLPE